MIFQRQHAVYTDFMNMFFSVSPDFLDFLFIIKALKKTFYLILMAFITSNISRCRVIKWFYRPTTGRKSKFFTLLFKISNFIPNLFHSRVIKLLNHPTTGWLSNFIDLLLNNLSKTELNYICSHLIIPITMT